ncbi:uncharacterized protein G2W53_024770 [Senna tora]|uniref:Uncharacterized protein n=1 Tax=Senna tora TaxID=362788 RepID=A0A834TCK6_9FABA|nr:uncharacterized protein G2W53_024770 [Senna tora]
MLVGPRREALKQTRKEEILKPESEVAWEGVSGNPRWEGIGLESLIFVVIIKEDFFLSFYFCQLKVGSVFHSLTRNTRNGGYVLLAEVSNSEAPLNS